MKNIETFKAAKPSEIPLRTLISIIHRSSTVYINHIIKDVNITAAQIPFLLILLKEEELAQEELATHYNIDKGAVARALKKLEDAELITREINETNRRKYKVSLTKKGEEAAEKIKKINEENEERIYKRIEPTTKEELHKILKEMALASMERVEESCKNKCNSDKEDNPHKIK